MERIAVPLSVPRWAASLLFLMAILCAVSHAQDRLDPAALGRARASVATTRGLGSLAANPGALDLDPIDSITLPQNLTFSLYSIGGAFGATYLSSGEFSDIFASGTKDRSRLSDLLQDDRLFANGGIDLLALRYHTDAGTWGLHFGERIFATVNFPDDFRGVIKTLNFQAKDYQFANRSIGGDWISELGVSYARSLGSRRDSGWFPSIGLGITGKLLLGVAHFDVQDNSVITVESRTLNNATASILQGGYVFRSALPDGFNQGELAGQLLTGLIPGIAGMGAGVDLGISGVLYRRPAQGAGGLPVDALYYGLALQDLGFVSWNKNAYERREMGINDTIAGGNLEDKGIERYQGTLTSIDGFTSNIPATLRAGIGVNLTAYVPTIPGQLTIDVEGELPLTAMPGSEADYRLAIGAEWSPVRWFAFRTGIGRTGSSMADVALGIGLRPLDWLSFDVGIGDVKGIADDARYDIAARLAAGFKF